jgi:hypothetical protein
MPHDAEAPAPFDLIEQVDVEGLRVVTVSAAI